MRARIFVERNLRTWEALTLYAICAVSACPKGFFSPYHVSEKKPQRRPENPMRESDIVSPTHLGIKRSYYWGNVPFVPSFLLLHQKLYQNQLCLDSHPDRTL